MNNFSLFLVVFLSCMLLLGDYFIKYSVGKSNWITFLIFTAISWLVTIYGWYYLAKDNRIAIVGMLFSIISLIGTVLIGICCFNEKLTVTEWLGFALAIITNSYYLEEYKNENHKNK